MPDEIDLSAGLLPESPKPRRGGISRDRILQIARSDNIPDDIADDFAKVMNFESGGSHFDRRGNVKLSPPDPKTGERAVGAVQIKPSTARGVGVDDPFDEEKNLLAGLRYFKAGGDDPTARRIHYFGGPKPAQHYRRTGRIPKGKDVLGTTFEKYVKSTGGQQQKPKIDLSAGEIDLSAGLEDSEQNLPANQKETKRRNPPVSPKQSKAKSAPITLKTPHTFGKPTTPQEQDVLRQAIDAYEQRRSANRQQIQQGSSNLGELRRQDEPEVRRVLAEQREVARLTPILSRQGVPRQEIERIARAQAQRSPEETAREQRVAETSTGEKLAQIPKSAALGLASTAESGLKSIAVLAKKIDLFGAYEGKQASDLATYQAGEWIQRNAKQILQSNPDLEQDFIVGKAPQAIGQAVSFLLGGIATKAPKLTVTILGAGMSGGSAYDEVKAAGGTDEEAVNAGLLAGAILGPTELIGMRGAMKAIAGTPMEATLNEALKKALREGRRDVIENAIQEAGQEFAQGLITGQHRTPGQLVEAAGLGAIASGVVTPTVTVAGQIGGRRARPVEAQPDVPAQPEAVEPGPATAEVGSRRMGVLRDADMVDPAPTESAATAPSETAEATVKRPTIADLIAPREKAVAPKTGMAASETRAADTQLPAATAQPQRFYHKDWGEVEVLEDQSGARPGRVKVAEVADPTKQHFPKRADLTGRGNQRMVPIKLEPSVESTVSPETAADEALRLNESLESGIVEPAEQTASEPAIIPPSEAAQSVRAETTAPTPEVSDRANTISAETTAAAGNRPTVLREKIGEKGGIIAQSPTDPEMWRLTHYDTRGFSGHEEYASYEEALRTAEKTYKLTEPVQGAEFNEIASSEKFAAGNELTQFVAKQNRGEQLTESDQARIEELNKVLRPEGRPLSPKTQALVDTTEAAAPGLEATRLPKPVKRRGESQAEFARRKILAEAESAEGKKIRPTPTHAVGRPKSDPTNNSVSVQARARGGIKPTENFRGEVDRLKLVSGHRGLVNERSGLDAEQMIVALAQDGYRLPGVDFDTGGRAGFTVTDVNAALEAIEMDAMGIRPLHSTEKDFDVDFEQEYFDHLMKSETDKVSRESADALISLLENESAGTLYERVSNGTATAREVEEFRTTARGYGVSDADTETLIRAGAENTPAEADRLQSTPERPAEQLGFVQEGLTQESAPPPTSKTPLRDRLIREEQDRQAELNPERSAAQAKLEEIRRRGMTVDDYARQPDLTGNVPSAEEVARLRALETKPSAVAPGRARSAQIPVWEMSRAELEQAAKREQGDERAHPTTTDIEHRIDRLVGKFSAEGFLKSEEGGFDLARLRRAYQQMRGQREALPDAVEFAGERYHELTSELLRLNLAISDSGGPDSKTTKTEIDAMWRRHRELVSRATDLERYLQSKGYKVNLLGEVVRKDKRFPSALKARPLSEKIKDFFRGEHGALDLQKLRARMHQLLQNDPRITDEELVAAMQKDIANLQAEPNAEIKQNFGPGTMRAGEPLPEVKERKFGKRFVEDERIADEIRSEIGTAKYYEPIPNKITAEQAKKLVDERGIGESIRIIRDEKNDLAPHIRATMGQQVILKLNQTYRNLKAAGSDKAEGVLEQAVDLAEWAMDYGTRLGQGVQSFAMWSRLTPEGMLQTYKRSVKKARERHQKRFGEDVAEIVNTVNKEGMTDAERLEAIKNLFNTNKTARKIKSDFERLLKAAKGGKLTDEAFYDVVGAKLGLPSYNKETSARIVDLANQIDAAPEGLPRTKLVLELQKFIAEQKGFDVADLPLGIFYGNILSGYNTHAVNFADTGLNVLSEINGLALNNPQAAAKVYAGMLRGFAEGRWDAMLALTEGRMFRDSKWLDAPGLMEVARFGQKGGVPIKTETRTGRFAKRAAESKIATPLNAYKYVSRAMSASDAVMARSASEARATLLAYKMAKDEGLKGDALEARVREILALDRAADFEAQAQREGFTGKEAAFRAHELREMARPKDLTADAAEFAGEATYNHTPHGTLGLIAERVGNLSNDIKPLKLFVPFTRIVANVTNRGLNYTPYGYKRAVMGWGFGKNAEPLTAENRRLMLTRATMGTAGMVLLGVLQEAGLIAIHGNGPSDREKRRQLQNAGWRPYSLQIGNTYTSYVYSPVGLGLSILGNMKDATRYHELEQKDAATRGAYAVARLGSTIFSQSFLSGLSRLFGALSEEPSKSVTSVKQTLGGTVAAFGVPNIARDMHRLFDNKAYQSTTLAEDLIRNTPFAALALKPTLNAFGEPVKLQRQRFFDIESSDPAWKFVIEKNLRVPVPGRTIEMEKGRRITPEEYHDLLKTTGPKVKDWILKNRTRLSKMKEQDAQDELSEAATRIRKFELVKMKMKVRKKVA